MSITSLIIILVSNSLTLRRDKSILYSRVSIFNFVFSILLGYSSYFVLFLSTGLGLYGGLFHISAITHSFHIFIFILTSIILLLTGFYSKKVCFDNLVYMPPFWLVKFNFLNRVIINRMPEMYKILEYPLIILFIINGAVFLISASDLVSIFISIELQSYGIYLLSAIYKNSEQATAGALMYFLLGGLSSCFILLGTSLLYANSGTTNLDNIYVINSISSFINIDLINPVYLLDNTIAGLTNDHSLPNFVYDHNTNFSFYDSYYIVISLIIMSIGFLFKVSAAPFHFWSPDVYDAIPTVVTTFVAIIAKVSVFIFLLELVHYISKSSFNYVWTNNLIISSLLSLVIGTVLGLSQSRIKRLYAYSTISHLGFILLGLSIHTIESIQAFMFYLIQYSLSNLNAFILLLVIGYSYYNYSLRPMDKENIKRDDIKTKDIKTDDINIHHTDYNKLLSKDNNEFLLKDKNNSPIQLITQLKGYFNINPMLALSLTITLFSFAGIPPLIGFFGKMMILSAAIDSGYIFMSLIAILTSVIGSGYYLFIVKEIYFEKTQYKLSSKLPGNSTNFSRITSLKNGKINQIDNNLLNTNDPAKNEKQFTYDNVVLSNYLSITISILTLLILLYILSPIELINITSILVLILFKI